MSIIVPWGAKGVYGIQVNVKNMIEMYTVNKTRSFDEIGILFNEAYPPKKVIDTLGAGDTFIGAYLYAVSCNMTIRNCMNFASKVAGFKVGTMGFDSIKSFANQSSKM